MMGELAFSREEGFSMGHKEPSPVTARVIREFPIGEARVVLVAFTKEAIYALGVQRDSTQQICTFTSSSEVAICYRAFLLLGTYLGTYPHLPANWRIGEYARDCLWIVDPARRRNLDASREAPVRVSTIRDRIGLGKFLRLRDLTVPDMPQSIQRLIAKT